MVEQGYKNTDKEIWRKVLGDYYSPSISVTEQGDIGIHVGGLALFASVEQWFAAGQAAFCVEERPNQRMKPTSLSRVFALVDAVKNRIKSKKWSSR